VPHFSLQITAEGAMVTAVVAVSAARVVALRNANLPVPNPVPVRALVDTGASCTCIDPSVLSALQLSPTGTANIQTPSTGQTPVVVPQYDVSLVIPGARGETPLILGTVPVIATELLTAQRFHALIGRDILSRCILHYNGSIGMFTVAF
jgi:hypothetical protein